MKHLLAIAAIIVGFNSISAKKNTAAYECIYEYTVKGEDKKDNPFSDVAYCILQIGNGDAKFYDYTTFQTDSVRQAGADEKVIGQYELRQQRAVNFFDQTVYQNAPKGKMTVESVITPNYFTYEDNRYPVEWTMVEATDTVCGYPCLTARGEYGGRTWTVKYAPEIPVQYGPWKLTGLPGLILDAQDEEGIHHFSAITFRNATSQIIPPQNKGKISTNRDKFIQNKNHFEKNPVGNLPPESISEMEIRKGEDGQGTILVNGVQLRMREHPYIPLELK